MEYTLTPCPTSWDQLKITRPPGPMKHSGSVIAFVEDPDGYKIELIQRY